MEHTLTEQLLLLLARVADQVQISRSITLIIRDVAGDLSVRKNYHEIVALIEKKHERKKLQDTFYSLIRNGYLKKSISGTVSTCLLTTKGRHKLALLEAKDKNRENKKFRKGTFLLVFFDIPEDLRERRDRLRSYLVARGFEKWQKSIWVCSFDVQQDLKKYILYFEIKKYVEVLVVKKLKWA